MSGEAADIVREVWRDRLVPIFGALWVLLPIGVWMVNFGGPILGERFGVNGAGLAGTLLAALLLGWAVRAAALLRRVPVQQKSAFARSGALLSLHLLAGAGFLILLGPGIVPIEGDFARAAVGAILLVPAWFGWSGLTSPSRRLVLGLLRSRRGVA